MISDGIYRVQMQFGRGEHYIPNQTNVYKIAWQIHRNYNKKITCPSHRYPHVVCPFNEIQGWYWFALICTNLNYT